MITKSIDAVNKPSLLYFSLVYIEMRFEHRVAKD